MSEDTVLLQGHYEDSRKRHAKLYLDELRKANATYQKTDQKRGLAELKDEWDNIKMGQNWTAKNASTDDDALILCSAYPAYSVLELRQDVWDRIAWLKVSLNAIQRIHQYAVDKGVGDLNDDALLRQWLNTVNYDTPSHSQVSENREERRQHPNHSFFSRITNWLNRFSQFLSSDYGIPSEKWSLDFVKLIESARWSELGEAYRKQGNLKLAAECQQQATAIMREIAGEGSVVIHMLNQGNTYLAMGRYLEAEKCFQQVQKNFASTPHKKMGALNNLGLVYKHLGKYNQALEHCQKALKIARDIGDRKTEGECLGNSGEVFRLLGQYDRAIECQQEASTIADELGDVVAKGKRLGNLGTAYAQTDQFPKAIECYEKALDIARKKGDRRGEADRLGNLGMTYGLMGEYDLAIDYQKEALAIIRDVGNKLGEANALASLGDIHAGKHQYEVAFDFWEQSRHIFNNLGLKHQVRKIDSVIAMNRAALMSYPAYQNRKNR